MTTKQEVVKSKLGPYLKANKAEKGVLLTELASVTGMHRQALIRRLNQLRRVVLSRQVGVRGRRVQYGPGVTAALRDIWETLSCICAERLHPLVSETVAVLWTLLSAQWNKGMRATKTSLSVMRARCPFPLTHFDFDGGSEFINSEVVPWCTSLTPAITVTRIRAYKKNDHARIEQKNYTNIRRWVGYLRYDHEEQVTLLNQLYLVLEEYLNFFVPSQKCIRKERIGSKYKRTYDTAQTAYQRVLAHPNILQSITKQLKARYATLNPKVLKADIERLQGQLVTSYRTHRVQ